MLEFRVLGPLEVRRDGRSIDLRGSKRRAVLALLVLQANEVVRTDRLIEDLWGEQRPANASAALHNHLSRLRKDLGEHVLVTKPWGYVLRADPEAIDLRRFESLVAEARPLPARERSEKLGEALALWRGPALPDLANEPALAVELGRLEELRHSALEQRIDARLELGEQAEVVPELEELIAEHPLRERLRGQLILALYRSGRQAEALETYRETRRVLVEELGIEPSPELRELERAILRQDPSLVSARAPSAPEPAEPLPSPSRWRWPRSPLLAAAFLLLTLSGAAAAIVATRNDVPHAVAAERPAANGPRNRTVSASRAQPSTVIKKKGRHNAFPAKLQLTLAPDPPPHGRANPSRPPARPSDTTTEPRLSQQPPAPQAPAAKPKPRPAKPNALPAKVYWLADDFADPVFDHGLWHIATHGTGISSFERNGRLELSITSDVVWDASDNGVDTHYGTQCLLTGDFDAKVEYEVLDWPDKDGMFLDFGAYMRHGRDLNWAFIGRGGETINGTSSETYGSEVGPSKHWVQTTDRAGALRLKRVKGLLITYYNYRGRWVAVSSGYARGGANLILGFATNAETFGHESAGIAFDTFQATATSVSCAGYPVPPRRVLQ